MDIDLDELDLDGLDLLRQKYQAKGEDVAQAWVEWWGPAPLAEVEAEKTIAAATWLAAIHEAWPEISMFLRTARWASRPLIPDGS